MKRFTGWTLAAVLAVSLLAVPAASARPVAGEAQTAVAGWTQVVLGWLAGLFPAAPGDQGSEMTSVGAHEDGSASTDPNGHGILQNKPQSADGGGSNDGSGSTDPNG